MNITVNFFWAFLIKEVRFYLKYLLKGISVNISYKKTDAVKMTIWVTNSEASKFMMTVAAARK